MGKRRAASASELGCCTALGFTLDTYKAAKLCRSPKGDRVGRRKFQPPHQSKVLPFSKAPYLDLLLKDLVVLLLLVQDMLLLCLLQSPLVHVGPVHLLELLTLLK